MAYSVPADLVDRYGEAEIVIASDRDRKGKVDVARVTSAIVDVDAVIDSILSLKYASQLPFNPVPGVVKSCSIDMALHRLSLDAGLMTEEKGKRAKECRQLLIMIGAGKADLGLPSVVKSDDQTAETVAEVREWTQPDSRGIF